MTRLLAVACVALVSAATAGAGAGSSEAGRSESIFFWTDSPGPSLWAMRPDGSNRHRLFRTPQNAKRPSLSPDGKWIAFDGAPPGKPPLSDFDIQVVRINGTGRRTLAGSPATEIDAQWLPDGTRLSFSREPRPADWRRSWIWTVRLDGSAVRRLGRGQFARWSPDGTRLVLDAPTKESEGDLFIVNADGSGRRRLLATPELEQPAGWSPDGKRILFTRFDLEGGSDVYVVDVDGTNLRRLTRHAARDDAAAWSPDGSRIVLTSERTGHPQVFVMNTDGSRQRNISRNRFDDEATSWR